MRRETILRVLPAVLCGMLATFAAATRGWREGPMHPSSDVVARVGDRVLTAAEAERLGEELVPDEAAVVRGGPLEGRREEAIRAWVCEELLYQEGLRRGVHLDDPVVRRRVADRVYEEDVASASLAEPVGEGEARAYHAEHRAEFARPARVEGIHVVLRFPEGMPAAERASRLDALGLAIGGAPSRLEAALATCEEAGVEVRVPAAMDRAQTEEEVARAFSRRVAAAYFSEEASRRVVVVDDEDGTHVLRAVRRTASVSLPFEECRTQVEDAVRRARSDAAYQRLLRGLSRRPDVEVPPGLFGE